MKPSDITTHLNVFKPSQINVQVRGVQGAAGEL
jgi:hypothetical protein